MTRYKHASKAAQRYFAIWRSQAAERPINARDAACRQLGVAAVERYRSAWMLRMKNQWWAAQQSKDRAIQHARLAREFRIGMLTLPAFPTRMAEGTMRVLVFDVDFPGEPEAGLTPYRDCVAVIFEYGGEETEGAFGEYLRGCLCDWYPGARVELKREEGEPR